jgi:hypothetical protein
MSDFVENGREYKKGITGSLDYLESKNQTLKKTGKLLEEDLEDGDANNEEEKLKMI